MENLQILKISADAPEELRPVDVDRIMEHACAFQQLYQFRSWLLEQNISDRTRKKVTDWKL